MAKWLDKYENGGEYLGTTNVGRNYSPAWGGQFQMGGYVYPVNYVPQAEMGGSIPGSVGFTYARTGSTPSEGPYAKKTLPSAQNGQEMSFYQHGLDWTPRNISKNGSVVKDNMGYWNPDNWGKVVEIDSPNITMQGVNQDLIGISDEGDVQYMEPGKDYKFKGKKVKEYPVAKYGVNQQDEKTAQHLDQLLNFTNYNKPTKGGWLDKY
jgi:hypothetical protein